MTIRCQAAMLPLVMMACLSCEGSSNAPPPESSTGAGGSSTQAGQDSTASGGSSSQSRGGSTASGGSSSQSRGGSTASGGSSSQSRGGSSSQPRGGSTASGGSSSQSRGGSTASGGSSSQSGEAGGDAGGSTSTPGGFAIVGSWLYLGPWDGEHTLKITDETVEYADINGTWNSHWALKKYDNELQQFELTFDSGDGDYSPVGQSFSGTYVLKDAILTIQLAEGLGSFLDVKAASCTEGSDRIPDCKIYMKQ